MARTPLTGRLQRSPIARRLSSADGTESPQRPERRVDRVADANSRARAANEIVAGKPAAMDRGLSGSGGELSHAERGFDALGREVRAFEQSAQICQRLPSATGVKIVDVDHALLPARACSNRSSDVRAVWRRGAATWRATNGGRPPSNTRSR